MTTTVTDDKTGLEVHLGPSEAQPGATNVVIYCRDDWEVNRVTQELGEEYGNAQFTLPARCADGRWGVIGRVWR